MSPNEFWQAVFIAVISKQGASWDAAQAAADTAIIKYTERYGYLHDEVPQEEADDRS